MVFVACFEATLDGQEDLTLQRSTHGVWREQAQLTAHTHLQHKFGAALTWRDLTYHHGKVRFHGCIRIIRGQLSRLWPPVRFEPRTHRLRGWIIDW